MKNVVKIFSPFLVIIILFLFITFVPTCKDTEEAAIYSNDPFHSEPPTMPKKEAFLPPTPVIEKEADTHFPVPPPPFTEGIFPCSECHKELEVNTERRVLENAHDDIILHHDEQNRWCLDCHNPNNRDELRLASGLSVSFEESYRLCGQCHGTEYRDWRLGIHGKRTGMWNGEKQYLLCAHCHNPHSPKFKPIRPEKAPDRPELIH